MWTKEQCNSFLKKTLGLELTPLELEDFWTYLNEHKLTPTSKGNGNNIGFTPLMLQNLINTARGRMGTNLQDRRFKRVSEEIMPALAFTLFLKKMTGQEHLIVSSDASISEADIILVPLDQEPYSSKNNRVGAFPVEAMFINEYAMRSVQKKLDVEKIAELIISIKFSKQYISQTTLLVTLSIGSSDLKLSDLSDLLSKNPVNPFHQVWVFTGINTDNCVFAKMCPDFELHNIDIPTELMPLMY